MRALRSFVALARALTIILLIVGPGHVASKEMSQTVFRLTDPRGDDRGDGTITYPRDRSFHPYEGLLDLTHFEVRMTDEFVYFYLSIGSLSNPWNAPEGFFHPRIDIFIHSGETGGSSRLLRPGPGVRFSHRYPWHYWLRIAPFGGTALFEYSDAPDGPGRQKGVNVTSSDDSVITVRVHRSLLPPSTKRWRYYVLVGSFDGFGADGYRAVGDSTSRWLLGSPDAARARPIVDLLAPSWGPHSQARQLRSRGVPENEPVLHPVGGFSVFHYPPGMMIFLLIIMSTPTLWWWIRLWTRSRR